jgi:hypothetical protein
VIWNSQNRLYLTEKPPQFVCWPHADVTGQANWRCAIEKGGFSFGRCSGTVGAADVFA